MQDRRAPLKNQNRGDAPTHEALPFTIANYLHGSASAAKSGALLRHVQCDKDCFFIGGGGRKTRCHSKKSGRHRVPQQHETRAAPACSFGYIWSSGSLLLYSHNEVTAGGRPKPRQRDLTRLNPQRNLTARTATGGVGPNYSRTTVSESPYALVAQNPGPRTLLNQNPVSSTGTSIWDLQDSE